MEQAVTNSASIDSFLNKGNLISPRKVLAYLYKEENPIPMQLRKVSGGKLKKVRPAKTKMLIIWAMCVTMTMANSLFVQIMNDESNALCPDEQTRCPADHECCKLEGGEIGCCLKQEVQEKNTLPFIQSKALSIAYNKTSATQCPDPSYSCSGTQTCCPSSGRSLWACCPYTEAVCCKDGKTCCPCGSTCAAGRCVKNDDKTETKESVPFIPRISAVPNAFNDTSGTPCPNPSFVCPGIATCCPSYWGKPWGCCSGFNAVCCSDGRHCCPSGYVCSACSCVRA